MNCVPVDAAGTILKQLVSTKYLIVASWDLLMSYSVVIYLLAGYCPAICSADRNPLVHTLQQS